MTSKQLYRATLIELNKENAPNILLEEFNYFANKAVNQYINKRYNIYDINQQTTDDLKVLKSGAALNVAHVDDYLGLTTAGSNHMGTYEAILPPDYLHLLNCICVYKVNKTFECYNAGTYWRHPATRLTADMYSLVLDNYWSRPEYYRPYYYIHNINTNTSLPTNPYNENTGYGTDIRYADTIANIIKEPLKVKSDNNSDGPEFIDGKYVGYLTFNDHYFVRTSTIGTTYYALKVTGTKDTENSTEENPVYIYSSIEEEEVSMTDGETDSVFAKNYPYETVTASKVIKSVGEMSLNVSPATTINGYTPSSTSWQQYQNDSIINMSSDNRSLGSINDTPVSNKTNKYTAAEAFNIQAYTSFKLYSNTGIVLTSDPLTYLNNGTNITLTEDNNDGNGNPIAKVSGGIPKTINLLGQKYSNVERTGQVRYGNASQNRIEIRYGSDNRVFLLVKVYIDYIKAPQFIRLTQEEVDSTEDFSQMLEYPDYVCQEIVNELVNLIMEHISDPRLRTYPVVSLSIANPAQALAPEAAGQSA